LLSPLSQVLIASSGVPALDAEHPDYTGYAMRTLGVLAVFAIIAGVLVVAARKVRRGSLGAGNDPGIKIESGQSLEPGCRLYIVEVDGTRSLIASGQSGVSFLRSLPPSNAAVGPLPPRDGTSSSQPHKAGATEGDS